MPNDLQSKEKLPPHSSVAEQTVLGSLLLVADTSPPEASKLLATVRHSDFYEVRHQTIFDAMRCLDLDKRAFALTALQQWLTDKQRLEGAGGLAYLAELPDKTPTSVSFESNLEILREKATRRELIRLGTEAVQQAGDESLDANALIQQFTDLTTRIVNSSNTRQNWIKFYKPSECRSYIPPTGHILVGDCHIVRGAVTVIGGPPGIGKSRAANGLGLAGATGQEWFGLKVHHLFKTLIIQNENGRFRLSKEFSEIHGEGIDDYIRVSEPPAYGMAFDKPEFRAALAQYVEDFKPDVVIVDPWNSVARDDKGRDYLEAFEAIRAVLPTGDASPALVIVAHTRKPRAEERASGRALLNLLAGSYVLGSVPRSVFVMVSASNETTDDRIVWTCCKNNDGELGDRTSWYRRNGLFKPCPDFDWKIFDGEGEKRHTLSLDELEALFEGGKSKLARKAAVKELMQMTKLKETACYEALKTDGRFKDHLAEDENGLLTWKP